MTELFRSELCVITREEEGRVIRLRRTALAARRKADYEKLSEDSLRAVPLAQRGPLGVLLDLRPAPLLNDERMEAVALRFASIILDGFGRAAVLVQTAVGALQARRIGREVQNGAQVFTEEAAALAFLTAPSSSVPVGRSPGVTR
jgi:hypothetical protein